MMQDSSSGTPYDSTFVLWLFSIMGSGVLLAIAGFIIVGVIAFRSKERHSINAYAELFTKGDVLRLLTVVGILASVGALAFAKLIEGAVAASILSGVAGYVLGGMSGRRSPSTTEPGEGRVGHS